VSTHRLCCCGEITPGSCADLMCIEEHPSTLVVSGISGVKRWQRTLLNVSPCAQDNCNSQDIDQEWYRLGEAHHQVNFGIPATVLRRVGANCCYVADNVGVQITWTYSQHDYAKKCVGDCPLKDYGHDSNGALTVPGCYRVECVSGPGIPVPYLVHRLSWCTTPAPDLIPVYKINEPGTGYLCSNTYTVLNYLGLHIAGQSICWTSPVQDLTTLGPGDYDTVNWCGCTAEGGDVACNSTFQTVHPCLTALCLDGLAFGNSHPMPFETSAAYDPENPPAPCSFCGNGSNFERCGGVVSMCGGGLYENNEPCYDCNHWLAVTTPEYA